jgi:hypothetical protein
MAEKDDHEEAYRAFKEVVNMTASALEKHLAGKDSQSVGQNKDGGDATGHQEGRRIVAMLHKKKAELTDDDYAHMRKVVGYVHRHLKQGGPKDQGEPLRVCRRLIVLGQAARAWSPTLA